MLASRIAAGIVPPSKLTTPVTPSSQALYNGGSAPWSDGTLSNGIRPMLAGKDGTNSTSVLQTIVEGPTNVSFRWRVNNGDSHMGLYAYVDDTIEAQARNNVWDDVVLAVPSGKHLVSWYFAKGSSATRSGEAQLANVAIASGSDSGSNNNNGGSSNTGTDTSSSSSGGGAAAGLVALLALAGLWRRRG